MTDQDQSHIDRKSISVLADAVSKAIQDNKGDSRFIDLQRIPLICLSIANISKVMDEIKDMIVMNKKDSDRQHDTFLTKENFHLEFDTVKTLVYGAVGLALIAMTGAIISIVLKQ